MPALPPYAREVCEMTVTAARVMQVARATRPDIIHAHSPALNALPAVWTARRLGIPVVYELRALWEEAANEFRNSTRGRLRYHAIRALESISMKSVDGVVTLCQRMRDEIISRGIHPEKIVVVPNAVDADRFRPNIPYDAALAAELGLEGDCVVGYIGAFYHYEGLDLLIDALPTVIAMVPNIKVLLVGTGPQESRLRKLVADRGLRDRVAFAGSVKNDVVPRYYSLLDMVVCPRRRCRLTDLVTPLKPLEAMAAGKPVLASDVGGHEELVRHGQTGVLFPAGDIEALATQIGRLANQPEYRALLAAGGRRYVEQERRWADSVANYASLYDRLMASRITSTARSRRAFPDISS